MGTPKGFPRLCNRLSPAAVLQDDSLAQGYNREDTTWEFHLYDYVDWACLCLFIAKSMNMQVKEGKYFL